MKKIVRALHLASFDGNIGDNANHNGFYQKINSLENLEFEITPLEIREFYWGNKLFDQSFVDLANSHDLLIIGGGNYFELWVQHSPTGTSIMIEPELFKEISVPVIFNALGVDSGQGTTPETIKRFKKFLSDIINDKKNFISVRNDGAINTISTLIDKELAKKVVWTPDAGINITVQEEKKLFDRNKRLAAINLAGDMLDTRFPKNSGKNLDLNEFIEKFGSTCEKIIEKNLVDEIIFIPHIHKDCEIIYRTISKMKDSNIRKKVSIAPLLHGQGSESFVFSIYKEASISISMRFHANICSIGLGKPTLGLSCYKQIDELYHELNLEEYLCHCNTHNFDVELINKVERIINNIKVENDIFHAKSIKEKELYARYISKLELWLEGIFFEV